MPYTYNGIGTKYYGKRDHGSDGSYITTEWITFVYFPLIPISSYRVCPTGKQTNAIVYNSRQFRVQKVPFNKTQIRNVYAVTGTIIAAIIGVLAIANHVESKDSVSKALPARASLASSVERKITA